MDIPAGAEVHAPRVHVLGAYVDARDVLGGYCGGGWVGLGKGVGGDDAGFADVGGCVLGGV